MSLPGQVNVLTANYDNDRTNSNNSETILSPASVNPRSFGKLGTFAVDGEIYAQPLYVSGLSIQGRLHNVVYVATMHDSVYAFDADAIGSGALWKVNLGVSVPPSMLNVTDVDVEVGILSTPVIDLGRQAIYVVSDTLQNQSPTFTLHALSLADGHEIEKGPVVITGSVPGRADGGQTVAFQPTELIQRPGLALLDRRLYVAFGSHADDYPWHGWMFAYDASSLQHQLAAFCTTANGFGASFWQSGRAPAIDDNGVSLLNAARSDERHPIIQTDASLYVATGNGDYDGKADFGESILRLSATNLAVMDWFTPDNWSDLNENDFDLGSSGVILVPGTNLLVTAGKSGNLYLSPRTAMGHLAPANSSIVQSFNNSGPIFDSALWNSQNGPIVYMVQSFGGPLSAFRIENDAINTLVLWQTQALSTGFAGIAISSDGGKEGSGIVWLATSSTPIPGSSPGILNAFDAGDLTHLLWTSTTDAERDELGGFAKFATPTVANGKVFVPTFSNQLAVYGLLGAPQSASKSLPFTPARRSRLTPATANRPDAW